MAVYNDTRERLLAVARQALSDANSWASAANQLGGGRGGLGAASIINPNTYKVGATPKITGIPPLSTFLNMPDESEDTLFKLDGYVDDYIAKFFPTINGCLRTIPDEWLCDVISGMKPLGNHYEPFQAIWDKARDRSIYDSQGAFRSIKASFAGRGFSLPPATIAAVTVEAERQRIIALGDINREIMVKQADILKEVILFAEQQALQYKVGIVQAMADLYKQWILLPTRKYEMAQAKASALASYVQAITTQSNVEVAFENLRMAAADLLLKTEISRAEIDIKKDSATAAGAQALGTASAGFSQAAGTAANAASSLVSVIEAA